MNGNLQQWPKKAARAWVLIVCAWGIRTQAIQAAVYDVGPGQPIATIAAVPALSPGDTVNIHCGTYNEVRKWTASGSAGNPITLRGVCSTGRPLIDGTGQDVSGNGSAPRAIWEFEGSYYVVDNLEFKNARNGNNAAGIRVLGGWVTVLNCKLTYSDMGFFTSTTNADHILVESTEIAFNGTGTLDGQSHNVYLTKGGAITFEFCYIHDSVSGENFKSRAHYTELLYNYIADGAESEVEGVDEADTTTPNSNMTMIGNILVSTPNRTLNDSKFINFGQDVGGTHNGTLYLVNNTLIAGSPSIGFLRSSATDSAIVAVNNIFYGSNTIVQPGYDTNITGSNNWMQTSAVIPVGFSATTTAADPGFADPSAYDFHLTFSSSARDIGMNAPAYFDGAGVAHSAVPVYEYVNPLSSVARQSDGALDAGAYEASASSAGTISVVVTSVPTGLSMTVDGVACVAPCSLQWVTGSSHTIAATSQAGGTGTQYVFQSWSDGGAASHTVVAPSVAATYTASFTTQYFLTTSASPSNGGVISPASGWFNSGTILTVTATANPGYQFSKFTGSITGTTPSQAVAITAPMNVVANFTSIRGHHNK